MSALVFYVNQTAHAICRHSFRRSLDSFRFSLFVFREKRKAKNKHNIDFDQMNVCIYHELFDWRKKLTHSLSNSLTHPCTHTHNSYNMKQTCDWKAKSKKQTNFWKTKNEKRKVKNKNNLDFDEMNVCIWHELFDWRKTLTHFLTHSLAHSYTHSLMYSDTKQ